MGAFAGWDMPLLYGSARDEHLAVRRASGVFDVSHMGQLEVTGAGARDALQALLTNDVTALGPGQGQYTLLCQDDGGVIDDLIVYALADRFLLVVNASNIAACRERLEGRLPAGVELADRSPEIAMLALQGPGWAEALRPLAATPLAFSLDYFEIGEDVIAGVPSLIARTGYTGEPGVELMCPWDAAPALWDALERVPQGGRRVPRAHELDAGLARVAGPRDQARDPGDHVLPDLEVVERERERRGGERAERLGPARALEGEHRHLGRPVGHLHAGR